MTGAILRIEAENVLVISNSRYSGALLRGRDLPKDRAGDRLLALQRLSDKRSRIVIASVGNEPVLDDGGGRHSIIAEALLTGLTEMTDDTFTLFDPDLLPMVVCASMQKPQFRPIKRSGYESGDVVFACIGG